MPRAIGNNDAPTPPGVRTDSSTENITIASYATTLYEYDYIFRGGPHVPAAIDASVPGAVSHARQTKEQLGNCVINLLAGYFPNYIVDGTRLVSIAADARFRKGFSGLIPSAAKLINSDTVAITIGLYNIHYDTKIVDLVSPTWGALGVIAEELSHGEQFIEMWQSLPDVRETNSLGGQKTRRPDHDEALNSWYIKYSAASAKAVGNGLDSYYGNSYEQDAQAKRASIIADLASKYPQQFESQRKLCP